MKAAKEKYTTMEKSRGVEDLRELRLRALLRDLVREEGRMEAAELLGVNYKTLVRAIESDDLSNRMSDALERLLLTGGVPEVARQHKESASTIWNGECRDWTAGWMPWRRRCEAGSKRSWLPSRAGPESCGSRVLRRRRERIGRQFSQRCVSLSKVEGTPPCRGWRVYSPRQEDEGMTRCYSPRRRSRTTRNSTAPSGR